ncbi:deoxycytidylate deaminase, partial [Coprococcus eutactus]|uniref:deoxycytidylate deaminase n=1 Tax=Coprococcus eutactus TaxID=33043 RepID=UPI00210A0D77
YILNYRGGNIKDAIIYSTLFPCNECAKAIIQCVIKEVVYMSDKYDSTDSTIASKRMFDMSGVKYRQFESKGKNITL